MGRPQERDREAILCDGLASQTSPTRAGNRGVLTQVSGRWGAFVN